MWICKISQHGDFARIVIAIILSGKSVTASNFVHASQPLCCMSHYRFVSFVGEMVTRRVPDPDHMRIPELALHVPARSGETDDSV
jgi:hypothetical protein